MRVLYKCHFHYSFIHSLIQGILVKCPLYIKPQQNPGDKGTNGDVVLFLPSVVRLVDILAHMPVSAGHFKLCLEAK